MTLRGIRARVRGLRAFGLEPGPVRVSHRAMAARRWATAWRRHVRPVRVGRLFVRPSWVRTPAPARSLVIEIDPGMAFGTGLHPSTRLCLRALLRAVPVARGRPARVVFDVGTGSGILAIAAARLGAGRVLAVDDDPIAVAVARENVRRNGVASRVRIARGDGLDRAAGRAHVIVANIVADVIIPLCRRCARTSSPAAWPSARASSWTAWPTCCAPRARPGCTTGGRSRRGNGGRWCSKRPAPDCEMPDRLVVSERFRP